MADEDPHSQSQGGSQQSFPESQRTYVSSQRSSTSSSHRRSSQDRLFAPPLPPTSAASMHRQLRHLPSGFAKLPVELHRRIITLALSPPDLSMPMQGLHSKEGTVLPKVCKLYASLTIPLLHSRILLPSPTKARLYLATLDAKPVLASYVRRLELQGSGWDVQTVLEVLRALRGQEVRWVCLSLVGLDVRGREGEVEGVLGEWEGVKVWEMYCPATRSQPAYPFFLPTILPAWSSTLTSLGLLLPPPHSLPLLNSLLALPNLRHLYLNAGSFTLPTPPSVSPPTTPPLLPLPPYSHDPLVSLETSTFYLHLLSHAKTHRMLVLLYLRRPNQELAEMLGRDAALREVLTITACTENEMFGHVFEDMEDPRWRRKVGWEGWNAVLDVPLVAAVGAGEGESEKQGDAA